MSNSTSVIGGPTFSKLPENVKEKLFEQIKTRRMLYELARKRGYNSNVRAVILGDKPGPGRPSNAGYHHTPFFSTKNTSLWLNSLLLANGIDEKQLLWFNVEHADGSPLDPIHIEDLRRLHPTLIVMGGNAEKWVRANAPTSPYVKVFHPSFAKRFKSSEPYSLISEIKKALR